MMMTRSHALSFVLFSATVSAFLPSLLKQTNNRRLPSSSTANNPVGLFGMSEWRELGSEEGDGLQPTLRSIPILPVDSSDVLLQGQILHLQLYQDDEVRLFQQALDHHGGIFGMGLMSSGDDDDETGDNDNDDCNILLNTVPLVEIEDYKMMGGDFGIFCKAKVVGRAAVHDVHDNEDGDGPISALCTERFDRFSDASNIELANTVASMCENLIADMSDIEESCSSGAVGGTDDTIQQQQQDTATTSTTRTNTRMERYQTAYQAALESDKQGYLLPATSIASQQEEQQRSWRELNAVSWAAFSTSSCFPKDSTFRLSALDMDNITNRLKLAMYWLSDVRFEVEQAVN